MVGKRIIHYEIVNRLGAGGMGEVYLAQDTRLGRSVALKILPEAFAANEERVARFEREARLLASLNHPNIAVLYGLERAEGKTFLVMELVQGETLAERVVQGPVPIEEALRIAHQMAQGLETAHEKGIVHRDLKPANIMVTPDEKVKILDFGLAKALTGTRPQADVLSSATLTVASTDAGIILGTAAYMSPEQARGQDTDARTDVFAFGCVLFEILVGRRAFPGDMVTEAIASVLAREPDFSALPARTHPKIHDILRRCLNKDPKQRWQAIGDVRVEIETVLADPRGVSGFIAVEKKPLWKRAAPAVISSIVVAAITAVAMWSVRPVAEPRRIARFAYTLGKNQDFTRTGRQVVAISKDGTNIAYVANRQLYLKPISEMEGKPIPGTDQDVSSPIFSPDGQWLMFYATTDGKLKKIPIAGGASVTLAEADLPYGASWDFDDQIIVGQGPKGIVRVRAGGGKPEVLIPAAGTAGFDGPQLLPGGEDLLFTIVSGPRETRWDTGQVVVQNLKSGVRKTVIEAGSDARFLPTGHIVYAVGTTLFAVPFDSKKLQVTAGPVPLLQGIRRAVPTTAASFFGFSGNGTLAWVPGGVNPTVQRTLALVGRTGDKKVLPVPPAGYDVPRISPDGKHAAVAIQEGKDGINIWIYDFDANTTMRRLTFGGTNEDPDWTPDGKRVVFRSDRDGIGSMYWQAADGSGTAERLTPADKGTYHAPLAWTPDGKTLAFYLNRADSFGGDIYTLSLDGDRKPKPLLTSSDKNIHRLAFSPDGRWIAYGSNEEGRPEVYVQPFPLTGAKYKITKTGGDSPMWSPDGKQLIFENMRHLMFVDVQTQSGFAFSEPKALPVDLVNTNGRPYDITPDGKQFLVMQNPPRTEPEEKTLPQINVVLNWFSELQQRVPLK